MGRGRGKRGVEERKVENRKGKSQKKEDTGAQNIRKVAQHGVFQTACGSGGSESRLAKAAGAEPCGQMRNEKLYAVVARSTFPSQMLKHGGLGPLFEDHIPKNYTLLWREAHFEANMLKTWVRSTCGSSDEIARCCGAKHISKSNVRNTPFSDHFWKFGCGKFARRCGAKHISKSKC